MNYTLLFLLLIHSTVTADDGAVVLKLANSLSPLSTGWSNVSSRGFCTNWAGMQCDSSGRVSSINLSNFGLIGTLPSEFSNLTELLFAAWKLPADLARCTGLKSFKATNSIITGSIPGIFASLSSLQDLMLGFNNLKGPLPPSMAKSGIKNLWLNNQLEGLTSNINVLASMTQLSQVWLHVNKFTGPIQDLSNCKSNLDLQLRDNLLTGIVPCSLVSLPSLLNVSLSNNKLQGPDPAFPSTVTVDDYHSTNNFYADAGVPCDQQATTLLQIAGDFRHPVRLSDGWYRNGVLCVVGFVLDAIP
ncbi:unnamed protein product [Dovyalis caffra]|uniref:Leucine-rich repeat-containing N-terminal plant-type domain-containing protein n=1 Tax=Dovyalis caffra TaxID=77055 RepID=A0AAV1S400_9ROSI|nr:unnamed protein product [Dovyalis caffra]